MLIVGLHREIRVRRPVWGLSAGNSYSPYQTLSRASSVLQSHAIMKLREWLGELRRSSPYALGVGALRLSLSNSGLDVEY